MRDHLPDVAIRAVCANYSRLTPWLEAQELRQEAALVALEAARSQLVIKQFQSPPDAPKPKGMTSWWKRS